MIVHEFSDGLIIHGDSTSAEVIDYVAGLELQVPLIVTDPPYGNIVSEDWDQSKLSDDDFADWMCEWTELWSDLLLPGGAFYVWGGIGKPGFRPFMKYLSRVERPKKFELSNVITWKKRRGYGVQNNYLFTREECAYFVKGNAKKPRCFNVPYLEELRGYDGYNKKYPAKSAFKRRTNVWTDVTEILKGKDHPTQKPSRVMAVPIEVHTQKGEWVIDPFGGVCTTAMVARSLGRKFVVIESDESYVQKACEIL